MFVVVLTLAALLFANAALAQTPAAPPSSPVEITGTVMPALQQFDNSANSSKLTEYRDFGDDVFVPRLTLTARNRTTGMFFDASASNLSRADASIYATVGRTGRWNVIADWTEIPHNYSNKAVTPYIQRAPGLFDVPATVPITFKRLATAAADTAGVLASDDLIAQYQRTFLGPTPLGTQTRAGHFSAGWTGSDVLNLAVTYDRRENTGSKATYGPIGDRPPRTLSVQLAEPVDYRTNDVTVAAEHQGKGYQLRAEYLLSDFGNRIDTMQWQNLYATPAAGASYDEWDRSVSVYGRRPLPPDNRYHNVTAMVGRDLPRDSRLSATATYGRLEQNETLLPYSYNVDRLAVQTLPRATADGSINTASFNADYVIAPARRLNLRAFYRFYNLDNNTPSSRWQYITSDTSNLNGTASYVNKRVSLPYAWDRHIGGAELTFRLPARNTISVTYERDSVSRVDREADTAEDIVRAVWRGRAWRGLSLEARYLLSVRDGGNYNNEVTHAGYWYLPAEANDFNNPALTFDNHPDMRRYDVSDRKRWQVDFRATATPRDVVAISAYARYRADDFNSDVRPTQPLLGTGLADETATTPGDQLGRLEDARLRFGADLFVQPTTRVNVNAFVNYDKGTAFDRSLEFNENNKANPSAVATAELGPWTRAGSQWTADFDDRTWNMGLGTAWTVLPDRVTLLADYTLSLADIDITYGGYGVSNFDGAPFPDNHQFAFRSPPTVVEDLHVATLHLEIPISGITLVAGYTYERYALQDWQQQPDAPWVEAVGAETLLRDTSRSFQWGNRLFNLGTYLAPSYAAHIGFVGFRYQF